MIRKIDMQVIGEMIERDYLDDKKMRSFVEMIESIHEIFKQEQTTDHSNYGRYIVVSGGGWKYEYILNYPLQCMELTDCEIYDKGSPRA